MSDNPSESDAVPSPVEDGQSDRQRVLLATAALAGLLVVVILVALIYGRRQSIVASDLESLAGLADQQYIEGHYEQALAQYRALAERSPASVRPKLRARMGTTLMRMDAFDEAEAEFRTCLDQGLVTPQILLNLGLSLYRQGEAQEAIAVYQRVIDEYSEGEPHTAARARHAIELIGGEPIAPAPPPEARDPTDPEQDR